jgi:hypothetical protein
MILEKSSFGQKGIKNYITQRIDNGYSECAVRKQANESAEFFPSRLFTLNEVMDGMHVAVQLSVQLRSAEFLFAMILKIGNYYKKDKKYTEKV